MVFALYASRNPSRSPIIAQVKWTETPVHLKQGFGTQVAIEVTAVRDVMRPDRYGIGENGRYSEVFSAS